MALMQIAEPGQSPDPHKKTLVLGIDLGTTHSLIASVKNGTPVVLKVQTAKSLCLLLCITLRVLLKLVFKLKKQKV